MSSFLTTTTVGISANILTKSPLSSSFFSPPHCTSTNYHLLKPHRSISVRAVTSSSHAKTDDVSSENPDSWMKLRLLIACPWEHVRKGSVLKMELRGQITDQLKTSFFSGLSLPQICENLIKAAYDPRISGVYLQIETLNCGWGIIEEIRRHILDFRKSGKFIVGYAPIWGEKEYYLGCACEELYSPPSAYFSLYGLTVQAQFLGGVLEKVGVESQVQRIGVYKSDGDQLTRKNISKENHEALTTLLDNIYENWVDKISQAIGKKKEEIESFINEGVYQIEKLKEDGWITDIIYDDEVTSMLKIKLGISSEEMLPVVGYKKYSRVKKWTLGLSGGSDEIAVIRASGSISRVREPFSSSNSALLLNNLLRRFTRQEVYSRYKAVIIRIDSPGGDALASDLMWREILQLAKSKPVIASLVDVAASGGYYMAMAAGTIVSENLTLTGSIGVFSGDCPQGRIWTGNDAASRGLVDAIGGFSRAVAIAKQKANIPQDKQVTLVELSRSSPSLPEILMETALEQLVNGIGLTSSDDVQARMDDIRF
ncbi:hypothetical protein L1987_80269 [Smallanthus sonchifolius]|uniref:Uncharacterized protein n=1 Tax=Smallanthus sonchifolius TaxID=185202 RepID=A0ACB8YNR9_9ASTR|nr:hypothetical protein L1987_80269 [Smallanthus sonchifolius]